MSVYDLYVLVVQAGIKVDKFAVTHRFNLAGISFHLQRSEHSTSSQFWGVVLLTSDEHRTKLQIYRLTDEIPLLSLYGHFTTRKMRKNEKYSDRSYSTPLGEANKGNVVGNAHDTMPYIPMYEWCSVTVRVGRTNIGTLATKGQLLFSGSR